LTATTAPGSGENLTIKRVVPLTQETDYPEGGQFPAQSHEDALDRGTMADQQLQEQIDRAVKLKSTSALSDIDFPEPGANKGVKWDSAGTKLVLTADDPDVAQAAAAASATAAASSESAASASEANAATSETNAATSETNAATSEADAAAAAGAVAYKWLFDSSVSMADPGTGDVRLNNATLSAVTQIAVSALTADTGNPDVSPFIVTWDDSLHNPHGTIIIRLSGTPATFVIYSVNGAITDNGTWLQIPVVHVAGNGSLTDTDKLFIHFLRAGDDGLGTGDLLAANNLSDLADIPTARGNLGLGTAAVVDTGVGNGDVPQMDATGYPAADGSQITNIDPAQATQAALEAETDEDTYAPPNLIRHNPGVAKGWVKAGITGNVIASYNVSSVDDTGTGEMTVNWADDFSGVHYVAVATPITGANRNVTIDDSPAPTAGTTKFLCWRGDTPGDLYDPGTWQVEAHGDQ
jgi:hypothetical protein